MSTATHGVPVSTAPGMVADGWLALRFALRELRGGLRGFYVLIACVALGVMAIAGIGSVAESLTAGLAREGRMILGGDAAFSLFHREASKDELAFLESRGRVSAAATMRAMARTADARSALVEVKSVDNAYPLYGALTLDPPAPLADVLAARDGVFGAAADPALLARLDLKAGSHITVGSADIVIRAAIVSEPDKLASGIAFGPRLLVSDAALRATGLVQPGSLIRWTYRVRLPDSDSSDSAAAALVAGTETRLPEAGWEVRTRTNASPMLERNVERFAQYLTLVGLTALLVGGVGVANAVRSHLDRKRNTIASMKSLGATSGRVFAIYLIQVLLLALIGAAIGIALGAAIPFVLSALLGGMLPLPIAPALHPGELALALLYGTITAIAFAMWPLGRAHDIPVSALFRDAVAAERHWPRKSYVAATVAVALLLAALAIGLAYDKRIAAIFVAAAAGTFIMLRLIALAIMLAARRLPHARMTTLRLAIANIHRPGALTPTIVLTLGLGIALLVTVIEIDGNLRSQFLAALPDKAPAFYFIDIQSADGDRFDAFVHKQAPDARLDRVPMLRGRIVAANNVKAEDMKPSPSAAWALQSDRGITFTTEVPPGSRIVEGQWWDAGYDGPPLLSMEKKIADGLGLKLGDPVTVNILGRNVTAPIANLRSVDWQGLGINFVLVYSPGAFRGAPYTQIATLTYPRNSTAQEENALLRSVADAFPAVTTIRVKDAIEAVAGIVMNLVSAVRGASLVTLLAAMLVLAGALAASHHSRVYDAVILKTMGATRGRLIGAYALEYFLLGTITVLFGMAAGSVAAWVVVTQVMNLSFSWLALPALVAACGALLATIVFGLVGTFSALGQKPGPVLRNL